MKTTVYLVRHAEAQSNVNPLHEGEAQLTQMGRTQAARLAKHFAGKQIACVYSSPILRAVQTADELAAAAGVPFSILDFLKERSGAHADSQFVPSEHFDSLSERIGSARRFFESLESGPVVAVSHAIFIKSFLAGLMLGEPVREELVSRIEDSLIVDNASVSKVTFNREKGKWRIERLNSQF